LACLLVWIPAGLYGSALAVPFSIAALVLSIFLVTTILWFVVGFLRANSALWRGDLDAVTSDDPPAVEPAGVRGAGFGPGRRSGVRRFYASSVALMAVTLLAVLLFWFWGFGPRLYRGSGQKGFRNPFAAESTARFVLCTMPNTLPTGTSPATDRLEWTFKCLLPAEHMLRIMFVRWTDGIATVDTGLGAYFKVGTAPVERDFRLMCEKLDKVVLGGITNGPGKQALLTVATNDMQWNVSLLDHVTTAQHFFGEPPYRLVEPPQILAVRSGHQGIVRLVDCAAPERQAGDRQTGIELRFFLEPLKGPVVRTNPLEVEGTNYVAGYGPGWTADQALKFMMEWTADK
jgi:hypothetical protein